MTSHNPTAAKRGTRPPTITITDDLGRECLRVPLDASGHSYATVLRTSYDAVRRIGAVGAWYLNANDKGQRYVKTAVPDGTGRCTVVQVARIIAGAGARSTIYYVNKDRLDLRPENLHWHRNGKSKRCDVKVVERGAAYRLKRDARVTK